MRVIIKILTWLIVSFFIIMAVSAFSINGLEAAIAFLIAGIILLPIDAWKKIKNKIKIGRALTVILSVMLFCVGCITMPMIETPDDGTMSEKVTSSNKDDAVDSTPDVTPTIITKPPQNTNKQTATPPDEVTSEEKITIIRPVESSNSWWNSASNFINKKAPKSENEILEDLKEYQNFIAYYITNTCNAFSFANSDEIDNESYKLTDVEILYRFTEEKESDYVEIKVFAVSENASYAGKYYLNYEYDRKEGFVLESIYDNHASHKYYNITPPDPTVVIDFFNNELVPANPTITELVDYSIEKVENDKYKAILTFSTENLTGKMTYTIVYDFLFSSTHWEIIKSSAIDITQYTW